MPCLEYTFEKAESKCSVLELELQLPPEKKLCGYIDVKRKL